MVPVAAEGDPRTALRGFESVIVNVSLGSSAESPLTGTVTAAVVVPGGIVRSPLVAV
jgi:hypothetical protein